MRIKWLYEGYDLTDPNRGKHDLNIFGLVRGEIGRLENDLTSPANSRLSVIKNRIMLIKTHINKVIPDNDEERETINSIIEYADILNGLIGTKDGPINDNIAVEMNKFVNDVKNHQNLHTKY